MTVGDLKPFCCTDKLKGNIAEPWTGEGFTQATCGLTLIRVAPLADVMPNELAPITSGLFPKEEPTAWHSVENLQLVADETCPICNGKRETVKCKECGGTGEIDLDTAYNTYTVECKTCEGEGETRCENCSGTGKIDGVTLVGGYKFSSKLLRRLKPLPDCVLAPVSQTHPAVFRFTGGDGLIMPMR